MFIGPRIIVITEE